MCGGIDTWAGLLVSPALGACLMLRVYIEAYGEFLGAAAFMPAVMIAALFGGVAEGITVFTLVRGLGRRAL